MLDTTTGGAGKVLFEGSDFVAFPRSSPDGRRLAWVTWNHPDMPWDTTTLYVATLSDSGLSDITAVTHGVEESVLEPRWDADGTLYFVSDRSNWWNLYRYSGKQATPVFTFEAEISGPPWVLGQSNYALDGRGRAVVKYTVTARDKLGVLDLGSGKLTPLDLPFTGLSSIQLTSPDTAVAIAASSTEEAALVSIDLSNGGYRVLRAPGSLRLEEPFIALAEAIEFPTAGGVTAHAFYYPPTNPDFAGLPGELPPLIVKVHGGPTSHSKPELAMATQYWTSRGFALLDVNHGGSTGFGRSYRNRLRNNWGVVDVTDVVTATQYLIGLGRVDGNRAAIRGGSAGGFTVLAALAFHDVFKAGANYYGVSDLEALAQDTHKFESRYLDRLVAPLPSGRAIYEARAPIRHLENFKAALITFQGSEDKVVPPSQSRAIVAALKAKGVPVAYVEFEGEQHGFRKAENIVRSLESELAFYGQVFGFTPHERHSTVEAPAAPSMTVNESPTRSSVVREPGSGWQETIRSSPRVQPTTALMTMKWDTTTVSAEISRRHSIARWRQLCTVSSRSIHRSFNSVFNHSPRSASGIPGDGISATRSSTRAGRRHSISNSEAVSRVRRSGLTMRGNGPRSNSSRAATSACRRPDSLKPGSCCTLQPASAWPWRIR